MAIPNSILVENFRSFAQPGPIRLKPVTLLVGENSSGKSSFLAGIKLAIQAAQGRGELDFNEPPFALGAYDQIAHFGGGFKGRAKSFRLGVEVGVERSTKSDAETLRMSYEFKRQGAQAALAGQTLSTNSLSLEIVSGSKLELRLRDSSNSTEIDLTETSVPSFIARGGPIDWSYILYRARIADREREQNKQNAVLARYAEQIDLLVSRTRRFSLTTPIALSPIRSRPLRTYQPTSTSQEPDGSHVPLTLARSFFEDKGRWAELKRVIDAFGSASGMFDAIDLKPLGKDEGDPFQLRVKVGGATVNIVDVGYGVSQVLPILVEAALSSRSRLFLLQQPEVHLHPRAQAELGTFIAAMVRRSRLNFFVETHSDYLINRLMFEIREKRIAAESCEILFFHKPGRDSKIYRISFDENGNLLNFPDCYRAFFLAEERRFLGI